MTLLYDTLNPGLGARDRIRHRAGLRLRLADALLGQGMLLRQLQAGTTARRAFCPASPACRPRPAHRRRCSRCVERASEDTVFVTWGSGIAVREGEEGFRGVRRTVTCLFQGSKQRSNYAGTGDTRDKSWRLRFSKRIYVQQLYEVLHAKICLIAPLVAQNRFIAHSSHNVADANGCRLVPHINQASTLVLSLSLTRRNPNSHCRASSRLSRLPNCLAGRSAWLRCERQSLWI
jgi:hypothetical protein